MKIRDLVPFKSRQDEVASAQMVESPFRELLDFHRNFDRLFARLFEDFRLPAPRSTAEGNYAPPVDVTETSKAVKVTAELPGLTEKDVKVEVERHQLILSGVRKCENQGEDDGHSWRECSYGSFTRAIPLPEAAIPDGATASFKNGVLRVEIPKSSETHPTRRSIEIQAA